MIDDRWGVKRRLLFTRFYDDEREWIISTIVMYFFLFPNWSIQISIDCRLLLFTRVESYSIWWIGRKNRSLEGGSLQRNVYKMLRRMLAERTNGRHKSKSSFVDLLTFPENSIKILHLKVARNSKYCMCALRNICMICFWKSEAPKVAIFRGSPVLRTTRAS